MQGVACLKFNGHNCGNVVPCNAFIQMIKNRKKYEKHKLRVCAIFLGKHILGYRTQY